MIDKYYRHFYSPSNILVTAAGNLKHKDMVRLVGDHLGDLKKRPFHPKNPSPSRTPRWCSSIRNRWNRCTCMWAFRRSRCRMSSALPATS